jgi:transcription termination/antitermination protein NusG
MRPPIQPLERSFFPSETIRQWFAVHTRAKHEIKVASELERKGVTAFVPTVRQVRQWTDRRKVLNSALFSCYAFVHTTASPQIRYSVLQTPGVLRWVSFGGSPCAIPSAQIEAIQRLLDSRVGCTLYPFLKAGQRVRIRGGCLEGLECILVSEPTDRKLVISIEPIQRSLCISAEDYALEPV